MLLSEKTSKTHGNYHQVTFKLAHIHTAIDCMHQSDQNISKSSRNGRHTQHSAICYVQNQQLPSLLWCRSATRHVNNVSLSLTLKSIQWKPRTVLLGYPTVLTRSSAIAEGPREGEELVKSCKTSHLKTRVPDLSCGIICVILRLSVLIQYRNVTDTQTDTRRRHIPHLA